LLAAPPTPRVLVRDALRRLVTGGEWPFRSWTVLQNRLLDEVGGDLRPLVALLVRAGEAGLVEQLPATPAAWASVRGALVLSLTNGAFLQPEMARWAVECWAFAVGAAREEELTVAADPRVAEARAAADRAAAVAAAAALAARPVARDPRRGDTSPGAIPPVAGGTGRAPTPRPAVVPARPTPVASGPVPPPGAVAPPQGRATASPPVMAPGAPPAPPPIAVTFAPRPPRPRSGVLPEGLNNPVARASLAGIAAFVGYVVYSAAGMRAARATEVDVPAAAAVPVPPNGSGPARASFAADPGVAPGIPGVTSHGLPQTAADSARMIRVVPARRPTLPLEDLAPAARGADGPAVAVSTGPAVTPAVAPAVAPRAPAPAVSAAPLAPARPDGYDRLRLRDGRVMRGRVELVRVAAVVFRDAETGLRYEYPKGDVDAVVTEFGSVVRFSPPVSSAPTPAARAAERAEAALVRRGVGGRYRVRYSLVSVTGSPECRRGWDEAPPPAWARVDHAAGADTLAVVFEGGASFASVIDGEAQFASTFVIVPDQAYTGSALTTRLNGRFTPAGFDAAVNLVGYRRVRAGRDVACHTVLRAEGERAAPAAR
jgi:hypothetical protein